MRNKITISNDEEIELNEREEKIYERGYDDAMWDAVVYFGVGLMVLCLIGFIIYAK